MQKVVLVGLDGFRPEVMDAALTPNLLALAESGVRFTHHRSVFPSETYVNVASILTGSPPGHHGIVANAFLEPRINRREPWIGSSLDMVEAGIATLDGAMITMPTLGDRLAAAEKRLWVLSGNSPGSARLKHPAVATSPGHLLLIGRDWPASLPAGMATRIASRLGEPPKPGETEADRGIQRYLTDAFLALAAEEPLPDVAVVWYGEPDHAFHTFGLGTEPTRATLKAIDRELGRLVDWWHGHPEHERIQLIVTSDHGHITQTKHVDTEKLLDEAGFRVGRHLEDGAELALVPGYAGNIRARNGDAGLIAAAAQALMAHDDVGMVFTAGDGPVEGNVPGAFSQSAIMAVHERSPDVVFTLGADDAEDPFGFVGTCRVDNSLPVGVGYHGGLHPAEMAPLLLAAGSAFGRSAISAAPSSVADLLPTILALIGVPQNGIPGRVLAEAFADPVPPPDAVPEVLQVSNGAYAQRLHVTRLGDRPYLDSGTRIR